MRIYLALKNISITLVSILIIMSIVSAQDQKKSLTPLPPMGWNAWNCFYGNIDEEKIMGIADAMVSSGMKDAGYEYVVVDDVWHQGRVSGTHHNYEDISGRDENGRLLVDTVKFPSGMKALADYVHAKGLKFGLYTTPGRKTCASCIGSEGFEELDIQTFVEWGVDFIKLDGCGWTKDDSETTLRKWRKLLDECGRPIVLSVNIERGDNFSVHRETANMYRTTTDINRVWYYPPEQYRGQASVLDIIDRQAGLEQYHGNGHWCDPDMLTVGNPPLTDDENRAHFSMWCIFAAPLIAGNDLRTMSDATRETLTNKETIEIAQDPAGIKGIKVGENNPELEIYSKRLLKYGTQAVALLNRGDVEADITVYWDQIGVKGEAFVRDLWLHKDMGIFENSYTAKVPAHGVAVLKISANEYLSPLASKLLKKNQFDGHGMLFEAEGRNCHFGAGRVGKEIEGYSGNGFLISKNHEWACFRGIWRINLEEEGEYMMKLRYMNRNNQNIGYLCNKTESELVLEKGNDWHEITKLVKLKKGINWIKISSPSGNFNGGVALDYIRLYSIK